MKRYHALVLLALTALSVVLAIQWIDLQRARRELATANRQITELRQDRDEIFHTLKRAGILGKY